MQINLRWEPAYQQKSNSFQQVITMPERAKLSLDLAEAVMEKKGKAENGGKRQKESTEVLFG